MGKEVCSITKVYHFSAGHRLYVKGISDEENWRIFGKCANPKGHGHDYYIEVKISGEIDPETGMVINLGELDELMKDVIDELDHKRLDIEVPYFKDSQPSGENIVKYMWLGIKPRLRSGKLDHLKLWETQNNYFEYFEEDN
ncbi:MAG: 6-carboxytetrahydropterin synthase [Thermodesulfobacteriota bacterium]